MTGHDSAEGGLSRFGRDITFLILGTVLGFLSNVFQEPVVSAYHDLKCQASENFARGKASRKAAVLAERASQSPRSDDVQARIDASHADANKAFEAAYACNVPEAGMRLGQAYCFGWSVPRDTLKGWTIIQEAVKKDSRLAVMLALAPRDFCPTD